MTASIEFFKDALLKILNLPEKIDRMLSTALHLIILQEILIYSIILSTLERQLLKMYFKIFVMTSQNV